MSTQQNPVEDLPPASKLVYLTLEDAAPATQRELAEATMLPRRTIRDALRRLRDVDVVEARPNPRDGRMRLYDVVE
ncbi:DNA-binding MarR family transcriptional regulator [Halarchaeum rubridurum]|uniref:DNA-binding MarR family transcriptional regulator n=1 Tax=Halarchaeum rubridurum TaxID=489911 RepID=A0A830FYV2_9EURY|nr:helix-turn-helix domain-containing protein [Halarchaeum rubridurum]MBP1953552.1 DNA-binding MarR family transcriptional regulator [Halarchaeum rubridurum]GGM64415.1 hypothetical protein GCM10009017_13080 [Halarchaeum rubridurum]